MASSVARAQSGAVPLNLETSLYYALLIGAVFAAYAGVYHNAFVYDDETLIVHNAFLRNWHFAPSLFTTTVSAGGTSDALSYYRPLQMLLYMAVYKIAGSSIFAFHLLNVALHAANACLVYRLGGKLGFKPVATFLAALLWALHPLQTEAVAYVSDTPDMLLGFFCLLGVTALLPDFTPRRMLVAAPLMILGLLSKDTAVVFPLLAMSCLYCLDSRRFELRTYLRLWPLILIAAVYVVMHVALTPHGAQPHGFDTAKHLISIDYEPFATLPFLLRLLVWPAALHMEHDFPVYTSIGHADVLAGIGLVLAASLQIQRRQSRSSLPFSWGLCWFAAAYLPAFTAGAVFYEHWMYLPSAGLMLGAVQSLVLGIEKLPRSKVKPVAQIGLAAALTAALGFGFLTFSQNRVWADGIALYANTVKYDEAAPAIRANLGILYAGSGRYGKALEQYQLAVDNAADRALSLANTAMLETAWGNTLLVMPGGDQHQDEALAHFRRALDADPESYQALRALALFYARRGDTRQSISYRVKAESIRQKLMTETGETPAASPSQPLKE